MPGIVPGSGTTLIVNRREQVLSTWYIVWFGDYDSWTDGVVAVLYRKGLQSYVLR